MAAPPQGYGICRKRRQMCALATCTGTRERRVRANEHDPLQNSSLPPPVLRPQSSLLPPSVVLDAAPGSQLLPPETSSSSVSSSLFNSGCRLLILGSAGRSPKAVHEHGLGLALEEGGHLPAGK